MTNPPTRTARNSTLGWGVALVALAAALWGMDGLFRRGLALELPPATIVFWEHLILVAITFPALRRGWELARRRLNAKEWGAMVLIGAGASATATALFTAAFRYGDPTTPLLLQKLQPVLAIIAAWLLLGERLRPRFGFFLAASLGSAWLITFADPTDVSANRVTAGLLAAGAAALWGMGTVLGRHLTARLPTNELTALRFGIGLPAAAVLAILDQGVSSLGIAAGDFPTLLLLALVPGLLALTIYYRGLRSTPASLATLAELAFPLSAVTINYIAFGTTLTATQWVGVIGLSAVLIVMSATVRSGGAKAAGVDAPTPGVLDPTR
ncbi:DMT family transporter [soil metagenome]